MLLSVKMNVYASTAPSPPSTCTWWILPGSLVCLQALLKIWEEPGYKAKYVVHVKCWRDKEKTKLIVNGTAIIHQCCSTIMYYRRPANKTRPGYCWSELHINLCYFTIAILWCKYCTMVTIVKVYVFACGYQWQIRQVLFDYMHTLTEAIPRISLMLNNRQVSFIVFQKGQSEWAVYIPTCHFVFSFPDCILLHGESFCDIGAAAWLLIQQSCDLGV